MNGSELTVRFEQQFQARPSIFSAPGRVNLIGEHTDYNDGFVLPSAIGFYTHVAVAPRTDGKLVFGSTEFPETFSLETNNLPVARMNSWSDYPLGVAVMLRRIGLNFGGASLLIHGEVPIGSGLSSSAAVEVATAVALLSLGQKQMELSEVAKICQKAENEFVGARVGIMDQFVSCHGKEGNALLLDCRSLEFTLVPVPDDVKLVICNTMVKHALSGGEYNKRREECEAGVRILSRFYPQVKALRDVSIGQLNERKRDLSDVVFKRCLHVVEENRRTIDAATEFHAGNLSAVGKLMRESHRSLRDLYEVSSKELDVMLDAAEDLPGFYGGRMTGGGFGGCTVNLVQSNHAAKFRDEIAGRYQAATGTSPEIYICSPADGAHQVTPEAGIKAGKWLV